MSDDPISTCPSCEREALERVISGGTGVIFKGGGFYINDSKRSGAQSSAKKNDNAKKEGKATATLSDKQGTQTDSAAAASSGKQEGASSSSGGASSSSGSKSAPSDGKPAPSASTS